jgi:hypothetical protein
MAAVPSTDGELGGHRDDRAGPAGQHRRQHRARRVAQPAEVHAKHPMQRARRDLRYRCDLVVPRRRDEGVDLAYLRTDGLDGGTDGGWVGHVGDVVGGIREIDADHRPAVVAQ